MLRNKVSGLQVQFFIFIFSRSALKVLKVVKPLIDSILRI